ncbi:hypothetical protein KI387_042131, partial [Taxus chinensis]
MLESSQWMIVGQPRDLARSSPVDNAQMYIVGKCPAEGRGIPTAIGIRSPLSEGLLLGFDPALSTRRWINLANKYIDRGV